MLVQVIDGLESLSNGGYLDMMKSIRQSISGTPHTVVFNECFNHASVPMVQNLLSGSIHRISLNDTITSLSSCIIQSVNVFTSEDEKLSKVCMPISMLRNKIILEFFSYLHSTDNCLKTVLFQGISLLFCLFELK